MATRQHQAHPRHRERRLCQVGRDHHAGHAPAPAGHGAVLRGAGVEVVDCDDLEQAVARGRDWAGAGGVVLLSPAAPSFGRYADYRARAQAFAAAAGIPTA